MFFRKFVVVILPLVFTAILCAVFPLLGNLGFFSNVLRGLLLGIGLNLLLPLCGATRHREPFSGMFLIPSLLLLIVVVFQFLTGMNYFNVSFLSFLTTTNGQTVLVESAFMGFLFTQTFRTKK